MSEGVSTMRFRPHQAPRRANRPIVEGLEARAMLSHVLSPTAHIAAQHATSHHPSAIISDDSSSPMRRSSKNHDSTIGQLRKTPMSAVSTVPANIGDVNPYGVAFVPSGFPTGGKLNAGDLLVSNFN